MEWNHSSGVRVSTDPSLIDKKLVFNYLHHKAYWSKGIPYDICMKSLSNSVPFTVLLTGKQIGFGRLITDHATFSYLCDVFIIEEFRGNGYATFLLSCINEWIDSHNIRTSLLLTRDAQPLYESQAWTYLTDIRRVMRYREKNQDFYQNMANK